MKAVDIAVLRQQYAGSRFYQLIEHHLHRQNRRQREDGMMATIRMLPDVVVHDAEALIDRWNLRIHDREFWQEDTAVVFDLIIKDARTLLASHGLERDDETAFNLFNLVVLNFARDAEAQSKMRDFIGIQRRPFPWPSALALLYPIAGTIWFAAKTPAGDLAVVGWGLAQLGYMLGAAAIFVGTFRVLGLNRRLAVFAAAIACFVVGTVLTNIGV